MRPKRSCRQLVMSWFVMTLASGIFEGRRGLTLPPTMANEDRDLTVCRRVLAVPRGMDRMLRFSVVKLVRAFGGCLGTKRR